MKSRLSRLRVTVRDLVRLGVLAILAPAADHLPREHALALAKLAGKLDASRALNAGLRREMQSAFELDPRSAAAVARTQAACRFLDFVVNRRLRGGREDPASWRIEERNPEVIDELRQSGGSFIIAIAHFARHPCYALMKGKRIPHRIVLVTAPVHDVVRSSSLSMRWWSAHLALMLDVWGSAGDVEFVFVGEQLVAPILVARLKQPGTAVVISVDAPTGPENRSVHRRPFAGHALQDFALGTAKVARLAGCPIVVCNPYLEPDGTVVLEWVGPITTDTHDADSDVRVMDSILDELERMIGRRPTQYVVPIGSERRWDAERERWQAP